MEGFFLEVFSLILKKNPYTEYIYDPYILSVLISNSIFHNPTGIKPDRFIGKSLSIQEVLTGYTYNGLSSTHRITIDKQYEKYMLLDGRHLLHAFLMLNKKIPNQVVSFVSKDIEIMRQSDYDTMF